MFRSLATKVQQVRPTQPLGSTTTATWPSLFDEARDMLEVAALIYHFATLRNKHRNGKIKLDDDRMVAETMNEPIESEDLHNFFSKNETVLRDELGDEQYEFVKDILERQMITAQENDQAKSSVPNPQLVVFDDKNNKKELVYAININHTLRRVVVVFRGSVTLNDFIMDAKIRQTHIPNPVQGDNQASEIALHTGFKEYLFGEEGESTKCEKIIKEVKALLKKHDGYKLYVTGHSLGAALATLFAFHVAAASNDMGIRGPVTCIPIASPKIGNLSFLTAFRSLEERGLIRLVRIENSLDLVTLVPNPYTFRFFAVFSPSRMYRHVGMSLKLYKNRPYSVAGSYVYRKMEPIRNIVAHTLMLMLGVPSFVIKRNDFFDNHSCDEYLERLRKQEDSLKSLALNNLLLQFNPKIRSTGTLG